MAVFFHILFSSAVLGKHLIRRIRVEHFHRAAAEPLLDLPGEAFGIFRYVSSFRNVLTHHAVPVLDAAFLP